MKHGIPFYFFVSLMFIVGGTCGAESGTSVVQPSEQSYNSTNDVHCYPELTRELEIDQKAFDAELASIDSLIVNGDYLSAFSSLKSLLNRFHTHYVWDVATQKDICYSVWALKKNIDACKNKLLDIIDIFRYEQEKCKDFDIEKISLFNREGDFVGVAECLCYHYLNDVKDSLAAIDLVERFFTRSLMSVCLIQIYLQVLEKNGLLRDGCSKIIILIDAVLDQNCDLFSAVMVLLSLYVVREVIPYMVRVDYLWACDFLKHVTQKILDRHLDNIAHTINWLIDIQKQVFVQIAEKFVSESEQKKATCFYQAQVASFLSNIKSQAHVLLNGFLGSSSILSNLATDTCAIEIIKMPLAMACLIQVHGGINQSQEYVQSIYDVLMKKGYKKVATLLADYVKLENSATDKKTFNEFCHEKIKNDGMMDSFFDSEDTRELNFLKKPMILTQA